MRLNNKVAIVTGSTLGIGKGIAEKLINEGAKVVFSDINGDDSLVTEFGGNAIFVKCDVSKMEEVENLINQAVTHFGQLDILVNNAGIYPFVPFAKMTEADWDRVMSVNLKSVFLCSQAAAKVMPEGARIINISSIASFVGFSGLVHYCASKGGVSGMIRALALELADRKITVNAVAPGAIETPGANQGSTDESKKQTIAMIPLSRMGQPEDIAGAVAFLASDQASYITGQTIIVDGGWTLR
jgi:NAD(P)-dependent dehydrogenase (short-subunit alcohol dehydrogenase family)